MALIRAVAHPKPEEVFPVGTVVRLKKTGEFALITDRTMLMGWHFLHYLGRIEGRGDGNWCLIHDEVELEAFPAENG